MVILQRSIPGDNNKKEEIVMKTSSKLMVLTIELAAVVALFFVPAYAQSPAGDVKPTFITLTPGLYVHGWPALTVSYPKEWVVASYPARSFFSASGYPDRICPLYP